MEYLPPNFGRCLIRIFMLFSLDGNGGIGLYSFRTGLACFGISFFHLFHLLFQPNFLIFLPWSHPFIFHSGLHNFFHFSRKLCSCYALGYFQFTLAVFFEIPLDSQKWQVETFFVPDFWSFLLFHFGIHEY